MTFNKHYTREEARALLPQVSAWLEKLTGLRAVQHQMEERLQGMLAPGCDLGGATVNEWVRTLLKTQQVVMEFFRREIQIKDIDRGLLDFPAIMDGKEVFLCWEKGEEDIEYWHDLDAGYAGREHL
jgi:hypothetical protein